VVQPAAPHPPAAEPGGIRVEPATPADFGRIAELTAGVYRDEGFAGEEYLIQLADVAGRAERAELLVARDRAATEGTGDVVGSVALVLDGEFGEVLRSPEEAGFRMLVVDPAVRGRGVGDLLVRTCLDRARAAGKRRMVLSTEPRMVSAHRLYERLGFTRLPERDWSPMPGVHLRVYAAELSYATADVRP
jgi:ribosomal protein S18 acetylase RimI-like enzyme